MKAFVIQVEELFKLCVRDDNDAFENDKRKLVIPIYQREYKWENDRIESFINDIRNKDKFLGNIILDAKDDSYEIVDGQQRITTLYLTLIKMYNHYRGHRLEQNGIYTLIKPYNNTFLFKNESIGDYIVEKDGEMVVSIQEEVDVYYQKEDFNRAEQVISDILSGFATLVEVKEFKRKLLDCRMLVLINDEHTNSNPVEQIFLDINEKAQLLKAEDIFKGHCFEKYEREAKIKLRETWVRLKKCGAEFTQRFGYSDLSEYLYHYLLQKEGKTLTEKLEIKGAHYLRSKTMDETERLLEAMIQYGEDVVNLHRRLGQTEYVFDDLCENSYEYRNTEDSSKMKIMLLEIMEYKKAQYQKIPVFIFIHGLSANANLRKEMQHKDFRKCIANLYIYAMLFSFGVGKKSKQNLDYTTREHIIKEDVSVRELIDGVKQLRSNAVNKFVYPSSIGVGFKYLSFLYTVIDCYNANENWFSDVYITYPDKRKYTLEHFIIPDNTACTIEWEKTNGELVILELKKFVKLKKNFVNYLVVEEELNGKLKNKDIVTKIEKVKAWFAVREEELPNHVAIYIKWIEGMEAYKQLKKLHDIECGDEKIKDSYNDFIQAYFLEETQEKLLNMINEKFKESFSN